ncbi:MAG: OB-fold domain-containing protein [Desulfovibrionaceae bacterium]|jgi:uncharacterized OB-fold protein|nr:OB-fold domain-containing protein [Desulfovibrionaceae bacterium]
MTSNPTCWTRGGDAIVIQCCAACGHRWLFRRGFCPQCAAPEPRDMVCTGAGTVSASTLVHRAPDDAFRAIAPYRLVLVELDEGPRLMAHAGADIAVGDRVRGETRTIAGQRLPFFTKETPA